MRYPHQLGIVNEVPSLSASVGVISRVAGGRRKRGSRSRVFTERIPAIVEQHVAKNAVPIIAVGFFDPAAARIATVVAGMSWIELVLMARKVHIAFEAVPGRAFSFSKSCMARSPRGVAALLRPSILAARFMTMEPIAGWLAGTSGKSHFRRGRRARARRFTRPDFSAIFRSPSQRAITPASGKAIFITAVLQDSKAAFVTPCKFPVKPPRMTEMTTSPSQM